MLSRIIVLFTLLVLLVACLPTEMTPALPTVPLVIPTPPTTAVTNAPLLPILLPNEANQWMTYHDSVTQYSLVLPQQWRITPPNPYAVHNSLTLANFDTSFIKDDCTWPNNLVKLIITSWETEAEQTTLDWIGTEMGAAQSLEAIVNGRYAGYLLTNDQQQLILRLTPNLILQIQVTPTTAWQLPDVQSILNSLAAPTETIELPAAPPTDPVAVPAFCHDTAQLYAGPGIHFEEVGLLIANDALPVIGRSHDGRWLKLLYPNTNNSTAWVSLEDAITTAGQLPIEPIQVQPGNS